MSTQELTLVNDVPLPLAKAEALNGLAVDSSASLIKSFAPHFTSFYSLVDEANAISEDEPNAAKAMRLKIVKIRTGADKTRSALKTEGLRIGKAIDGINHLLLNDLTPVETRLNDIEKREERLVAARIAALAEERRTALTPYIPPEHLINYDLGNMPVAQYDQLIMGAKAAHEAKLAAAAKAETERLDALKKAEEARLTKEAADKAERDKLAAENAKLAAQAEEARKAREAAEKEAKKLADAQKAKDAKIAAERAAEAKALADKAAAEQAKRDAQALKEKQARDAEAKKLADIQAKKDAEAEKARKDAEAKIKAEKDRADALEAKVKADAQAKIDTENKAKADAKKAADKAAKAPDRAKVEELANKLSGFKAPALKSEAGVALAAQIDAQLAKFVKWLNTEAGKL